MFLRRTLVPVALLAIGVGFGSVDLRGQESAADISRRAKTKVEPAYPELARKMNLSGVVRVQVVVSPSGAVKEAKILGGHPVLANAALDAAKKWRFEPASMDSTGVVDFKFAPR